MRTRRRRDQAPEQQHQQHPLSGLSTLSHASEFKASKARKEAENAAVLQEESLRLSKVIVDIEDRREPHWRFRCSSSAILGILIWVAIGLFIYYKSREPKLEDGLSCTPPRDAVPYVLPEGCRGVHCTSEGGTEAFGAVLGVHDGVYAYSNCYAHTCISFQDCYFPIPIPSGTAGAATRVMRTGMKWQCVEYARRYWMLRGRPDPAIFGSVDGAADIWTYIRHVTLLDNVTTAPLFKYANGARLGYGGSDPRVGDLLIYPRDDAGVFPFGHVAVIVGVEVHADSAPDEQQQMRRGLVYIGEQNWHSNPWPEPYHNYSRSLLLQVELNEKRVPQRYTIIDPAHRAEGWVRYGDP